MSKKDEALKLALEALAVKFSEGWHEGIKIDASDIMLLNDAAQALAEQPAQQALDKMAENARELGLDYEPVWGSGFTNKDYEDAMRQRRLHQLTSPPAQRTWVGLTDEDLQDVIQRAMHSITGGDNTFTLSANKIWVAIVREVEAKLRSKNEDLN